MYFRFVKEYKSIKKLPINTLPDFTIITGANGAGKTHFLESLINGSITVDYIEKSTIGYYNWSKLSTSNNQTLNPRALEDIRNEFCAQIYKISSAYKHYIMQLLNTFNATNVFNVRVNASEEKILDTTISCSVPQNIDRNTSEQEVVAFFANIVNKHFNEYKNQVSASGPKAHISYIVPGRGSNDGVHVGGTTEQFLALENISTKSSKPIFALTMQDCISLCPLILDEQDPFIGSLNNLFAGYTVLRTKNATNKVLAIDYDAPVQYLSKEDFVKIHGLPPWQIFNDVLSEAKLTFRFKEPPSDISLDIKANLYHVVSDIEIDFSDLSSGERILISLAHFLFFSKDSRQPTIMPQLVLLDEVDAPLHPSMTVDLLRTITNVLVKKYARKVILATHSPSTVALASEDSIHVMEVETKLIRKVTRDEGVQALTVGVPVLSINILNRRQVFLESLHDVSLFDRIAEIARPHLLPDVSLSFMAAGHEKNGGCALLISLVKQLNEAGNKAIFGIVDWDGNRVPEGNLRVLGQDKRHSIENYLLDPVLLGALLLREKAQALGDVVAPVLPLLEGRENYFDLRGFDNARLQRIADVVVDKLGFDKTDLVEVRYINGRSVQVPKEYLHIQGHLLEDRIQKTFPELKRFHQEPKVKKEILHKILEDIPELLPADFVHLLTSIQKTV